MNYSITIDDNYVAPEGALADNAAYVTFVMNRAAESYKNQYGAADFEAGITAAREAYNASLPQPTEP